MFVIYSELMKLITNFGDRHLLPYVVAVIVIYALTTIIMNKDNSKHYILVWFNVFVVLGASMFVSIYITDYLKEYVAYPRPYAVLPAGEVIQLEGQYEEQARKSFPSGHAAFITVLVVSLWPILNEWLRWVGLLLTVGVCWSRIALGVHFPMDVLSGFVISLVIVILIRMILFKAYSIINGIMYMLSRAR